MLKILKSFFFRGKADFPLLLVNSCGASFMERHTEKLKELDGILVLSKEITGFFKAMLFFQLSLGVA